MTFEFVLRFSGVELEAKYASTVRYQESLDSTVGTLRQSITERLSKKDAHFTMCLQGIELVDDDMGLYPLLKHEYGELVRTVDVTVHDRPVAVPIAVPIAEAPDAGGGGGVAAAPVAPVAAVAVAPVFGNGDDNSPTSTSSSSSDDE